MAEARIFQFSHRWATEADIPVIQEIMDAAITELQRGFLTPEQIAASNELMGLDTQLIDDGSYLVISAGSGAGGEVVGCGGWSKRKTLFGGNHTGGRDEGFLDPASDAAPVRAMYTRPSWVRRGIGRVIIALCEAAAREAGFKRTQLMATLSGEPLYLACGYKEVERREFPTTTGHFRATDPNGKEYIGSRLINAIHSAVPFVIWRKNRTGPGLPYRIEPD